MVESKRTGMMTAYEQNDFDWITDFTPHFNITKTAKQTYEKGHKQKNSITPHIISFPSFKRRLRPLFIGWRKISKKEHQNPPSPKAGVKSSHFPSQSFQVIRIMVVVVLSPLSLSSSGFKPLARQSQKDRRRRELPEHLFQLFQGVHESPTASNPSCSVLSIMIRFRRMTPSSM
jgi:hypothetical protein